MGRLNKQKNQSYLFKLVSNLKETKLLLVGNGPYEQKLKNEVEKLGLENKVIFCGAVKNVNDYLMAADIFLLCKYNQKKLFEKGYDLNENLNKLYNFYCEKLSDFCEILKK